MATTFPIIFTGRAARVCSGLLRYWLPMINLVTKAGNRTRLDFTHYNHTQRVIRAPAHNGRKSPSEAYL